MFARLPVNIVLTTSIISAIELVDGPTDTLVTPGPTTPITTLDPVGLDKPIARSGNASVSGT